MRRSATRLGLSLAVLVAGGVAGQGQPEPPTVRPTRVLFVLVDCLRYDRLGAHGYERSTSPHFDRLVRSGVLFEECVSTSTWTKPAVASLFTGVGPIVHGVEKGGQKAVGLVETLAPDFETLIEAARAQGYVTLAFTANPHISAETGLAQGFDLVVRTAQFGPGLARDFIDWLDQPYMPDPALVRRLSESELNRVGDWRVGLGQLPAEIEATESGGGVRLTRRQQASTGSQCVSFPLGRVPAQGGPFMVGLSWSVSGQAFPRLETGTRRQALYPIPLDGESERAYLRRLAPDGGDLALTVCFGSAESSFTLHNVSVLPEEALREERTTQWFAYLHLMNTHLPYRASAEYSAEYSAEDYGPEPVPLADKDLAPLGRQKIFDSDDLRVYRARYDASVEEADAMLGSVVEHLRQHELLDDTLIVVTADHGEQFLEHGAMGHGTVPYAELLRVPLLFHFPQRLVQGRRIRGLVSLLDVYPTLVDLLGVDAPEVLQGRSLSTVLVGKRSSLPQQPFLTTHTSMARVITTRDDVLIRSGLKLIIRRGLPAGEVVELYDLRADPRELRNLAAERPDVVQHLRGELDRERTRQERLRQQLGREPGSSPVEEETIELLESLGYVIE